MIDVVSDRLPPWLASADPAGPGLDDAELVAAADAHATGLVWVGEDGSVRWTDEAYRLHGRPRWRRVRSIDDLARGLSAAEAGRVTAAYLMLVISGDVELHYTVTGETGQPHDVLLRGAWPGLAMVQRAPHPPGELPAAAHPAGRAAAEGGRHDTAEVPEQPSTDEPAAPAPASEPVVETVETVEVVGTVEIVEVVETALPVALPDPETDQAFRALFDASPSGLAELREDGTFVRVNDAFCRLVGRTWDSLRDTVYEALIHHEDRASVFVSRTRREGDSSPTAPTEHRLLHSDGTAVWVRARTSPIESADGPRLLVSLDNVTASRAREEQLKHDALHDALTGLPNRRLVLDRLERAVSRARRAGQRLAVFFIDVDDLKHVNDTHPWQHRAGDVLLTSIAVGMRAAVRETDTLGRLAGDEFLVICEEVGDDVAVAELAERLLEATRQPVPLGPQTIHPTVSIGLALSSDDDETAEELLARADSAMYVAKSHGGGRVERADELTSSTPPDLVGALQRGELRMQYQPVVSLATGAVLGMSAVLRWAHPSLGMLPAHQVRTALDSAAVLPVVDWCIDRAINDVRTVAPSRVDHVSVWLPVPGRAVQATSTRDALRAAVLGADGSQTPDTAPSLVLDVHETDLATLARRPSLRRQLAALTDTGPVVIGVEHLSADVVPVGALQLLGAASASVDPELLLAASENESGEALVRSLVTGATALGVVTIATGVSSTELLEEARRLGVHAVSGDLIGPAASLEVYSDLLHGERVTLPGAPEVTVVRPFDDEDYVAPGRPVLSAIRALEEDVRDDLLAEALADDADAPLDDDVLSAPADLPAAVEAEAEADPGEQPTDDPAAEDPTSTEPDADPPEEPEPGPEGGSGPPPLDPAGPERSGRLLLGDVVDLAEQVARELGVALPSPAAAPRTPDSGPTRPGLLAEDVARELGVSLPGIGSHPQPLPWRGAPVPVEAGLPSARTQPRLPGLADLHAALVSPEVTRALPERADVVARPLDVEASDAVDIDLRDVGPDAEPGRSRPSSRPGPHIVLIDDVDGSDAAQEAGIGLRDGAAEPVAAPEAGEPADEPAVDLRVRGDDGPHIVLRPLGVDTPAAPGVAPTLHLRGLGGSDGGSIL